MKNNIITLVGGDFDNNNRKESRHCQKDDASVWF